MFHAEDIPAVLAAYRASGAGQGPEWDAYRHAHMHLPRWFRRGLDPYSSAYAEQQHRLWRLVAGVDRDYDAGEDEREFGWDDADAIRAPGFWARRDRLAIGAASDHVIATGMLLKHSGLVAGDHALEYGAGFAQSALALARLGVEVDTVDISEAFCRFVREQAAFHNVPLRAHHGRFGEAPVAGRRYRLIWFYESFHHCVDFLAVLPRLDALLDEGGRIILGGEPVVEREYAAVPYPWGVRLHAEVAAVMRQTRWFELGFSEDFLHDLFQRHGYLGQRIDCEPSQFGRLYIFKRAGSSGKTGWRQPGPSPNHE